MMMIINGIGKPPMALVGKELPAFHMPFRMTDKEWERVGEIKETWPT